MIQVVKGSVHLLLLLLLYSGMAACVSCRDVTLSNLGYEMDG